jgi:caa(3)-type oxidase subunit IV
MSPHEHDVDDAVRRSLRLYLLVGIILFAATLTTVAVATLPWLDVGGHGFDKWDALLGIMIAATKAGLVAAIFMHLNHERKMIYLLIGIGVIHACGLFIGTYWHYADIPHDRFFLRGGQPVSENVAGFE